MRRQQLLGAAERTSAALSSTRLRGRWLAAARVAWVALVGLALVVLVVALPDFYQASRTILAPETQLPGQLTADDVRLLQHWGLSLDVYAAYQTAQIAILSFVFTVAGALLFWRRSDDPMALFISLWFALVVPAGSPLLDPLIRAHPAWELPVRFLQGATLGCFPIFTYLFPNGRFVPHWTRMLTLAWMVWIVISPFTPFAVADFAGPSPLWFGALIPGGMAIGILAQVYRYRRVSGRVERQQTKWVLFGLGVVAVGFGLYGLTLGGIPAVGAPGLPRVLYLLFTETVLLVLPICLLPLFIGLAILRYRLWDIDQLINRALVYGVLTALLALVYGASVVGLQRGLAPLIGPDADVATIASTLAIAALFNPLRQRIQAFIDRSFYRRKYDATKTLAAFSATLRAETDLDAVRADLLAVVEETLQPAHVSLWLREIPPRPQEQRGEATPP